MPIIDISRITDPVERNNLLGINEYIHNREFNRYFQPGEFVLDPQTTLGAEGQKYSPDRFPSAGGVDTSISDEFDGSIGSMWRWGNQGSATDTYTYDTALMTIPNGAMNARVRWVTAPSAVDFSVYAKIAIDGFADYNNGGLILLESGTEATPTSLRLLRSVRSSSFGSLASWFATTRTSYAGGQTNNNSSINDTSILFGAWLYYWIQYTASSKATVARISNNGMLWFPCHTWTLGSHPVSAGRFGCSEGAGTSGHVQCAWFRIFTAAAGASSDQLTNGRCGE